MWEGEDLDFLPFISELLSDDKLLEKHSELRKKLLSETMNPIAFFDDLIRIEKA
jgi:hypothetical protein